MLFWWADHQASFSFSEKFILSDRYEFFHQLGTHHIEIIRNVAYGEGGTIPSSKSLILRVNSRFDLTVLPARR